MARPMDKSEVSRMLDEAAARAWLGKKVGQTCLICQGKILREESGSFAFSPFYCEDCVVGMEEAGMTPKQYAKEVHEMELLEI